jgi:hypothetical protein
VKQLYEINLIILYSIEIILNKKYINIIYMDEISKRRIKLAREMIIENYGKFYDDVFSNEYNYDLILEKLKILLIESCIIYNNYLPEKRFNDDFFKDYIDSEFIKILNDLPYIYEKREGWYNYYLKKLKSENEKDRNETKKYVQKYPFLFSCRYYKRNPKEDCIYIFHKNFWNLFNTSFEIAETRSGGDPKLCRRVIIF